MPRYSKDVGISFLHVFWWKHCMPVSHFSMRATWNHPSSLSSLDRVMTSTKLWSSSSREILLLLRYSPDARRRNSAASEVTRHWITRSCLGWWRSPTAVQATNNTLAYSDWLRHSKCLRSAMTHCQSLSGTTACYLRHRRLNYRLHGLSVVKHRV
jgi:hypothetical protein